MRTIQDKVGRRIRVLRIAAGIPQGTLALMTGITKSYMSEIEAGKKNLTLRSLERIADALGVPLSELFRGL
ncbi:helix-turn-helix domain-containing protein [uncultured Adlercreutzia sp.]|uniref:helix-turn-helix domain-containing protein n=1 Tax=uncultured Adlercreutzia sp. TaxID=875803 RepID=UPI0025DAD3A5|nr:helix-turn-helix transcriptional regulator [uncultured Adlercreutzia sp.]MCI9260967.1 helix-turn-helix transcriptional regulator [Eggerthellaceae bacterium]MEE0705945.1 helix-turn-helix transcriptional regulator [Adlercreutzia sp.]